MAPAESVLGTAQLFARAIERLHTGGSVVDLVEKTDYQMNDRVEIKRKVSFDGPIIMEVFGNISGDEPIPEFVTFYKTCRACPPASYRSRASRR